MRLNNFYWVLWSSLMALALSSCGGKAPVKHSQPASSELETWSETSREDFGPGSLGLLERSTRTLEIEKGASYDPNQNAIVLNETLSGRTLSVPLPHWKWEGAEKVSIPEPLSNLAEVALPLSKVENEKPETPFTLPLKVETKQIFLRTQGTLLEISLHSNPKWILSAPIPWVREWLSLRDLKFEESVEIHSLLALPESIEKVLIKLDPIRVFESLALLKRTEPNFKNLSDEETLSRAIGLWINRTTLSESLQKRASLFLARAIVEREFNGTRLREYPLDPMSPYEVSFFSGSSSKNLLSFVQILPFEHSKKKASTVWSTKANVPIEKRENGFSVFSGARLLVSLESFRSLVRRQSIGSHGETKRICSKSEPTKSTERGIRGSGTKNRCIEWKEEVTQIDQYEISDTGDLVNLNLSKDVLKSVWSQMEIEFKTSTNHFESITAQTFASQNPMDESTLTFDFDCKKIICPDAIRKALEWGTEARFVNHYIHTYPRQVGTVRHEPSGQKITQLETRTVHEDSIASGSISWDGFTRSFGKQYKVGFK